MEKRLLSNIANYKDIALGTVTNKDNWRGLIVIFLFSLLVVQKWNERRAAKRKDASGATLKRPDM